VAAQPAEFTHTTARHAACGSRRARGHHPVLKKIEAIIRPQTLGAVMKALAGAGFAEVTVSEVQGKGRHQGGSEFYRGAVYVSDTLVKLHIELVVPDERVDEVVSLFCRVARARGVGNGKVLVASVMDVAPGLS
jgi:nitrogen regulatory protein PII